MNFQLSNFQLRKCCLIHHRHHSSLVHVHLVLLLDCVDNWMHMTVMALCDHHLLSLTILALVGGESLPSEFVVRRR